MEERAPMCGTWGEDELFDLARGGLQDARRAALQAHLPTCEPCRQALEDLSRIAGLSGRSALEPSPEADRAVRDAIQRAAKPPTRRQRLRRVVGTGSGPRAAWIAAAAVVFGVLVLAAVLSVPRAPQGVVAAPRRPEPPPPQPPERVEAPRPQPETPRAPAPQIPLAPVPPPPAPPSPSPHPAPAAPPPPAPAPPTPSAPPTVVARVEVEFGRVLALTGRAERGGRPLARGDRVVSGEALSCPAGVVLVEAADQSLLALRAGSACVLERVGDDLTLRLSEGELACSVRKRPSRRFAVETVHGTATVRGTVFSVRVGPSGAVLTVVRGRVEAKTDAGAQDLEAGQRCSMARGAAPGRAEAVSAERSIAWAYDAGLRVVGPLWIVAGGPGAEFQAPMTRGRLYAVGALGAEPVFSAVDSRTLPSWTGQGLAPDRDEGGWVSHAVEIPEAGPWFLWARLYSPGSGTQLFRQDAEPRQNDPNSFFVRVDGGREMVLGNHKVDPETRTSWYRRWHWGGDGTIEVGRPGPLALGTLAKGRHVIRVRTRDAVETQALHLAPRLDVICLAPDRDYRPRDEDFRR